MKRSCLSSLGKFNCSNVLRPSSQSPFNIKRRWAYEENVRHENHRDMMKFLRAYRELFASHGSNLLCTNRKLCAECIIELQHFLGFYHIYSPGTTRFCMGLCETSKASTSRVNYIAKRRFTYIQRMKRSKFKHFLVNRKVNLAFI